jgi:hypothetical protein
MQDLTPEQQVAVNNHEEMHKMFNEIGSVFTGEGKASVMDEVSALGNTIAENTRLEAQAGTLDAPDLQPTTEGTLVPPTLESVLQSIAEQFALLSTVIKGGVGAGNSLSVEDQSKSLQDCVSLTLQQADWFKEMVRGIIDDTYDFEAHAEGAVETVVEKEVEHYFDTRFCPEDHFDFGDAVSDAVDDRLDDIVSDKIDDVVQEKFDDFMENATITINK